MKSWNEMSWEEKMAEIEMYWNVPMHRSEEHQQFMRDYVKETLRRLNNEMEKG